MIKVNFINDTVSVIDNDVTVMSFALSKTTTGTKDIEEGDDLPTGNIYVYAPIDENDEQHLKKIYQGVNGKAVIKYALKKILRVIAAPAGCATFYPGFAVAGDYAVRAGGKRDNGDFIIPVPWDGSEAYDAYLTKSLLNSQIDKYQLGYGTAGTTAIFQGGFDGNNYTNTVDTYDENLTHGTLSNLPYVEGQSVCTNIGDYLIIGGGGDDTSLPGDFSAYDSYLTRSSLSLSSPKLHPGAASTPSYAVFAGGYGKNERDIVKTTDAFDETLTRISASPTPIKMHNTDAGTVGEYAVIYSRYLTGPTIAYDDNLVANTGPTTTQGWCIAVQLEDYGVFYGYSSYTDADIVDPSLTLTTMNNVRKSGYGGVSAAVSFKDMALFCGGDTIDVSGLKIQYA